MRGDNKGRLESAREAIPKIKRQRSVAGSLRDERTEFKSTSSRSGDDARRWDVWMLGRIVWMCGAGRQSQPRWWRIFLVVGVGTGAGLTGRRTELDLGGGADPRPCRRWVEDWGKVPSLDGRSLAFWGMVGLDRFFRSFFPFSYSSL
jgi:hypothetical protein